MINQCKKGKRVELELVNWMKALGVLSAKRTEQHCGKAGDSDVVAQVELPTFHIESKGTKSAKLTNSILRDWCAQMETDCKKENIPVLFNKANNKDWVGVVTLDAAKKLELNQLNVIVCAEESVTPSDLIRRALSTKRVYKSLGFKVQEGDDIVIGFEYTDVNQQPKSVIFCSGGLLLTAMLRFEKARADAIKIAEAAAQGAKVTANAQGQVAIEGTCEHP